ncbi:hypothetical protein I4U23_004209 [Adineta vaga]|nr:hypothetical protein I4U23_004209 [Adineta vaga]
MTSRTIASSVVVLILVNVCLDNDQTKCGLENVTDILNKCAQQVGLAEKELLDYTVPFYCQAYNELFTRCSFRLIHSDFLSAPWFMEWQENQMTLDEFAHSIAAYCRGWLESILEFVRTRNKAAIR